MPVNVTPVCYRRIAWRELVDAVRFGRAGTGKTAQAPLHISVVMSRCVDTVHERKAQAMTTPEPAEENDEVLTTPATPGAEALPTESDDAA